MDFVFRFLLGLGIGSFINVIALRYEGDAFLMNKNTVGGRSRCPNCRTTLRWFELIPLVSFLVQKGKCRTCHTRISFQYPIVELISALIFIFVPMRFESLFRLTRVSWGAEVAIQGLWVCAVVTLLLITLIDLRTYLIPNELNIFLIILGTAVAIVGGDLLLSLRGSFVGSYSLLLGFTENIFTNRVFAGLCGALFFLSIVFLSKGRGMGMGDVKLVGALGILFGWPDIILLIMLSFIIGGAVGVVALLRGTKQMKSALPFGPFLAIGAVTVFFFGEAIVRGYFALFPVL